ncbi:glutathione S-transferase N-terminal domain-containing protein, partial [Pantoea agglomerans]|uniref:glutathione S-transferase N-terminal domain-containing protein n=1 Tax=Enterobacter agglomerans TaxID=549 RepID=UPI001F5DAA01
AMKIYDWYDGPYPARVRIALAEKGLLSEVEFIPVNLWKGDSLSLQPARRARSAFQPCLTPLTLVP